MQTSGNSPATSGLKLRSLEDVRAWGQTEAGLKWEAQLQRAAQRLKERYSHMPFYAAKAKNDPDYWIRLAGSEPNLGLLPEGP